MDRGAWRNRPWGCKELDRTEQLTLSQPRKPEGATMGHPQDPSSSQVLDLRVKGSPP